MENKFNEKNEYRIREVFDEKGKDIQKILRDAFKEYCETILQKVN